MQQLRDKLSIAERAAKAEAQLKVCCHPKSLWCLLLCRDMYMIDE